MEIVNAFFAIDATPQQMKTAMSDALIAKGAELGYTLQANDIILPDLQRG